MAIFDPNTLRDIASRAHAAKVHNVPRELLFSGIDPAYADDLLKSGVTDKVQLELDVMRMNDDGVLGPNVFPLLTWLTNVKFRLAGRSNDQGVFEAFADRAAQWETAQSATRRSGSAAAPAVRGGLAPAPGQPGPGEPETSLERFIFKSDLLPVSFLGAAVRAANAVCRIEIKRHFNGEVQLFGNGLPVLGQGTGWLIGKRHVITNHHVINARLDGEANASEEDLRLQCETATIQFGFDDDALATGPVRISRLCHSDQKLDFAIVELVDEVGIDPMVLSLRPLVGMDPDGRFAEDDRIPVNIIQHPNGASKQIAIRNNLAVACDGRYLSYFTDTDKGSSGSPVCDDRWRVVGLHKAATRTQGTFDYQGKTTAWINVGTPIVLIIDHLRHHRDAAIQDLWGAIGAVLNGQQGDA